MIGMISVVLATRNRAAVLAPTLEALGGQDPAGCPYEILVVDNGSSDDTARVVAAAVEAGVPIVGLREERPGKSHALNAAIARARGDLLAFIDDDVLPAPGWLAAQRRAIEETGADYVTGRILPLWEAPPPRWLSPALYGGLSAADGGTERISSPADGTAGPILPMGGNMAVRRRVLDRIGGWNPDLGALEGTLRTGEDHEFGLRMVGAGFRGVYEPAALVHHRVPATRLRLAYFWRWHWDNGAVHAALEQVYPPAVPHLLDVPRYLWRQSLSDALSGIRGLLTFDSRRAATAAMRLTWFAGYLRERWSARRRAGTGMRTAASGHS
jgi:glucosyl-dolichyl phosphate glucuronosyltransferase